MNRRTLLGAAAFVPVAALLACGTQTSSQVATDVNLIASGVAAAIASIKQIPGVPTATLTQLEAYLAIIQADAAKVASATATPRPRPCRKSARWCRPSPRLPCRWFRPDP